MSSDTQVGIVKASVIEAPLSSVPIPAADVVSGTPETAVAIVWHNQERTLGAGIWHCTPGKFYAPQLADETVVLIEGQVTLTPEGGTPIDLAGGDVGFIPAGIRVLWDVRETVRKGFHIHDQSGRVLQ